MSLPATDDFAGTGGLSGSWTVQQGSPSRASGVMVSGSSTENTAFWNADVFNNDQYSQILRSNVNNYSGPSVRCSADTGANTDMYWYVGSASGGVVYKMLNGAYTALFSADVAGGHTAKLTAVGTTIELFDNGVSAGSATDSALASGSAGAGIYGNGTDLDDWEGGNTSVSGPTAAQQIGIFDQELSGQMVGLVYQ
jgi:hypothetical protein